MIDATQNQARPQAACYPGFDAAFEAVKERIDRGPHRLARV